MRFVLTTLVMVGCAPVEPVEVVGSADAGAGTPIHPYNCTQPQIAGGFHPYTTCDGYHEQGRHLLSFAADGLAGANNHVSIADPRLTVGADRILRVNNVAMASTMVFAANGIANALQVTPLGGYRYAVFYQVPPSSLWKPYCVTGEPAYAMEGAWTTTGLHNHPSPMRITFACATEGKAGECEDWGYIPGTNGLPDVGERGWDLNQACTQMAMANYCMDGKSHTREKTPVLVRDLISNYGQPDYRRNDPDSPRLVPATYPPVPPPPDEYLVEALWEPRAVVKCLSKLRWNDQPPDGPCGLDSSLKDPRSDSDGAFCEDLIPTIDHSTEDHRIINASLTMDLPLHRWANSSGQTVTSVHGYVTELLTRAPTNYASQVAPTDDDVNEGFLLRNRPGTVEEGTQPDQATRVYRLTNMFGDEIVGPLSLTSLGYARTGSAPDDLDFEGWLLNSSNAQTLPFNLYVSEGGTDHVTTTDSAKPSNYFPQPGVATLGYVIGGPVTK